MTEPNEDPTDETIESQLASAPTGRWEELWKAVDELADEAGHTTWAGGEQVDTIVVDGVEKPVVQMPYVIYTEAVTNVVQDLHALGLIVPFAWPEWDGTIRYRAGRGLPGAPVADAVRMVTAIVRADRFCEGTIAAAIEDGTLTAELSRLRKWYDEDRRPA